MKRWNWIILAIIAAAFLVAALTMPASGAPAHSDCAAGPPSPHA